MRRIPRLLLIAIAAVGCDELFEGLADPNAYLGFTWPVGDVNVPQGGQSTATFTIRRQPDYRGGIEVAVLELPSGATATVDQSTVGEVETAVVTFNVAETLAVGTYPFTVRVRGKRLADTHRRMFLRVLEPPAYAMTVSGPQYSAIRGGVGPLAVTFDRTNFESPITLSVTGVPGITAVFGTNPVTSDSVSGVLMIDGSVEPGVHAITVVGVAPQLADRSVPLSVTVSDAHLQVLVDGDVEARQGHTTQKTFILNQSPSATNVALSVEGLPGGITPSFAPGSPPGYVMSLAVVPSVATGEYPVTLRATANGVPDATAQFLLAITQSGVALSVPDSISAYQGSTKSASITLQRTALDTTIAISFENLPAGFSATATPDNVPGNSSSIAVTVASNAAAGAHDLTIVATPAGWPADAASRATLRVTVRAVPAGTGNVLLDWSTCTAPAWLAVQDGTGPWTRVFPTSGFFRFTVDNSTGAFAFLDGTDVLSVRYMTRSHLIAEPFDMCPSSVPTRSVTGTGVHTTATSEQYTYGLGGAFATSTASNPNFTLLGIRPGLHDLVVWSHSTLPESFRGMFLRDLEFENGGSLGPVDLADAFAAASATPTVMGLINNESTSHTMSYLTTSACTENLMYSTAGIVRIFGVPEIFQRPSDFHHLTIHAATGTRVRSTTTSFNRLESKTVGFINQIAIVAVSPVSGSYKRLSASAGNVAPAYNGSAVFRYQGGTKSVEIRATRAALASTSFVLTTPDFTAVDGWESQFGPDPDASGSWTVTLDGGSGGSACSLNYSKISAKYSGTF